MTVITTARLVIATGNGATTEWPFLFEVPLSTDLVVRTRVITTGVITTIASSQYSVTGIGIVAGGTVTYPLSGSPLASTVEIIISRVVPFTQLLSIKNQDGFNPEVVEDEFDDVVFQTQQLSEDLGRTFKVPFGETMNTPLPKISSRLSKYFFFDAAGNPGVTGDAPATTTQDFDTRTSLVAATVDGSINLVITGGYYTFGDLGGALYKRVGAEPSHDLKAQSSDGTWWELVSVDGQINVMQNGAKADGTADDAPAIQGCIEFLTLHQTRDEYASTPKIIFPPTDDFYLCNSMLTVNRTTILEGASPAAFSLGAVTLKFADGVAAGIWVQHPAGDSSPGSYTPAKLWSGWRAELRSLALEPVNSGMVDYGVVHNIHATFDHVETKNFKKAGFFAHGQSAGDHNFGTPNGPSGTGTMFGNTNLSLYQKCMARTTTEGHGFVAQGNNTQVMHYDTCDATGNKGCGFRDNSGTGNVYTNCHTAQNTIKIQHPDFVQDTGLSSPFTTVAAASALVQVTKTTHGMIVGDKITIANAETLDDILAAELNGQRTIAVIVGANDYQFTSGGTATAGSQSGGGSSVNIGYDGLFYMPIIDHTSQASDEPGRGANWRDFWIVITATTQDDPWATSTIYRAAGGYNVTSVNAEPAFFGCYSEGGIEFGIIPRGDTLIMGGVAASFGRVSRHHDGFAKTQIYGSKDKNTPALWKGESDDGADTFGSSLGNSDVSKPDFFTCGHSDDPEHTGGHNLINFKWNFAALGGGSYEWQYDGGKEIMAFTPAGWDNINLDPADVTLGDFDTRGFAYFEDGLFFGARPTMLASSNSFAAPVSPLYLPKGAKISFTNNATTLPHMIHCITGGKVGVLSWNAVAGTLANTDTRTGDEISAGVVVAAFEPLTPRAASIQSHIADPSGGGTVDTEGRAAIDAILNILEAYGMAATS